MGSVLREVGIDCNDPRRVAEIWGEVLGWDVEVNDGVLWMSESGAPSPDFLLVFAEVARLEALGATRIDVGQGDQPWVVLADPEGNEFCVVGRRFDAT